MPEIIEAEDKRAPQPTSPVKAGQTALDTATAPQTTGQSTTARPDLTRATPLVSIALHIDSTSDPDKLEEQLKLLRQYGVI